MFNVSKIADTIGVVLTITGASGKSIDITFNAKKGSQTHAVIDLINKSFDHDNNVEILTGDELVASVLKIYTLCGSTLKTVNAANVARLQMRCLMNDGRARRRSMNFTLASRGRKKTIKVATSNDKVAPAVETVDTTTVSVDSTETVAADDATIGDTMEDATTTDDVPEVVEEVVEEVAETTNDIVADENAIETAETEVVEEVSPVKAKKSSKKAKKTDEVVAA